MQIRVKVKKLLVLKNKKVSKELHLLKRRQKQQLLQKKLKNCLQIMLKVQPQYFQKKKENLL
ncbi:hypothetical protein C2G38_2141406 [Gigaspora rosea]|uniref:Uncharacterized protein n=1 Tax=Gigaspora rosea TaxID=44941 RepID=A0A397VDU0_9GLOM|nr:hypothetical protein C2G38_2141406 [Gigaspora rosea]